MRINISKETIVNVAKTVVGCFGLGVLARYAPMWSARPMEDSNNYYIVPCYSEAVRVIMQEFTFDSNRNEAVKLLKRDEDVEYYAAVIEAVRSCTFDSNRIELIKTLSEK